MLIDSHCHLSRFVDDLDVILDRAASAGIEEMITIGTEPPDWDLYKEMAFSYPGRIHYTVGLHPSVVNAEWAGHTGKLDAYMREDLKPVALGEVGLDYFRLPKDKTAADRVIHWQKEALRDQLVWSRKHDLPVVVHSRAAFDDTLQSVDESGVDWNRVVFHCFAEGPEAIQQLNNRGGRGSFTGILTYKKSENIREAALKQGMDFLMVETDSPYLTPEPHRGKPNEPSYLRLTAEALSHLFELPFRQFALKVTENTRNFFRI